MSPTEPFDLADLPPKIIITNLKDWVLPAVNNNISNSIQLKNSDKLVFVTWVIDAEKRYKLLKMKKANKDSNSLDAVYVD